MNADDLKAALQPFYDNYDEIGVALYAVLKGDDGGVRKLDVEGDSLDGLKGIFVASLKENVTDREDLTVLDLSTSDERTDAIYRYDLDVPEELTCLEDVINADDLPVLNLADNELSKIKAILVEIGNDIGQIVLYKTMAPVNIFGRASFFLKKHNHRLEKIDDEFLRVSPGFQLARVGGELFVLDLSVIEKAFGFHGIIVKEATAGIAAIEKIALVNNAAVLHELIQDIKYARRLTKVAKASPVLRDGIANEKIIDFCKKFPTLTGKIRFTDDGTQIVLDTKVSKDLFIKVLMDDLLTSELTNHHYESHAKDAADKVEKAENPEA